MRKRVLSTLPKREVTLNIVLAPISEEKRSQYILTDAKNPLVDMQEKASMHHWTIMRQILPDVIWETY